jgi:hypothetical protein
VLNAILEEMRELRQQFETFSNGGFPLRQTVPTSELLAAAAASSALLARDLPLTSNDVQRRLQMAMLVSRDFVALFDQFQMHSQPQQLDQLTQR